MSKNPEFFDFNKPKYKKARVWVRRELAKMTPDLPQEFELMMMNSVYDELMEKYNFSNREIKLLIDSVIHETNVYALEDLKWMLFEDYQTD